MKLTDLFNKGKKFQPQQMPEVEVPRDMDGFFADARTKSLAVGPGGKRNLILITPGRLMVGIPCAEPGTMDHMAAGALQKLPDPPRNVTAIAFNKVENVHNWQQIVPTIPFLGFLLGFGYVGHSVIIFEGHRSALAAGLKDADLLMVDEAMIPHLQPDWLDVAYAQMRKPQIMMVTRDQQVKQIVRNQP